MVLPFLMGQGLLRKLDLPEKKNKFAIFLGSGENFTFANACADRTKHGTKKLLV